MIFIPRFQSNYSLSFHLNHEGMNYIADNFNISRIIWNTNMTMENTSSTLVYPNKCLSKCRDRLCLTYKYLQGPTLVEIASQVHDLW